MTVYNGTSGNDNYTGANKGTQSADSYYTYGGNDSIDASGGDDFVSAGSGADVVYGGDGNDQIYGGDDADTLYGDLGNDVINGDAGNDFIIGGLGDDQMYGGDGNDTFSVDGVTGLDAFYGGAGTDAIILQTINPYAIWGEIKISGISGIERIANLQSVKPVDIVASGSLDLSAIDVDGIRKIIGGSGSDAITGTSNASSSSINDVIDGQGGNDILGGGLGNDTLIGGSGADKFVFGTNEGSDTVSDFSNGIDLIDLRPTIAAGFGDLTITSNSSGWAQIVVDGTTITLTGVTTTVIDASDFLF